MPRWSSSSTRKSFSARASHRRARRRRPRRLEARAALEEDEERLVATVLGRDLAREDGDLLAVGARVVERDRELVLGEYQPMDRVRDGHRRFVPDGCRAIG